MSDVIRPYKPTVGLGVGTIVGPGVRLECNPTSDAERLAPYFNLAYAAGAAAVEEEYQRVLRRLQSVETQRNEARNEAWMAEHNAKATVEALKLAVQSCIMKNDDYCPVCGAMTLTPNEPEGFHAQGCQVGEVKSLLWPPPPAAQCPICHGKGSVETVSDGLPEHDICEDCGGTGCVLADEEVSLEERDCTNCGHYDNHHVGIDPTCYELRCGFSDYRAWTPSKDKEKE